MPFLYDNLTATVIGMTIFLILASLQMRTTKSSVTQSARKAALAETESAATWIEEDLKAMGKNLDDSTEAFTNPSRSGDEYSPTGSTLEDLSFRYRESLGDTITTVDYEVVSSDTMTVDGETRTLYGLERQKNGIGDGGASATLGYFDVQFVGKDAGEIANPQSNEGQIRGVHVHFSVIAPYRNNETVLHEVHRKVAVPYAPNR